MIEKLSSLCVRFMPTFVSPATSTRRGTASPSRPIRAREPIEMVAVRPPALSIVQLRSIAAERGLLTELQLLSLAVVDLAGLPRAALLVALADLLEGEAGAA